MEDHYLKRVRTYGPSTGSLVLNLNLWPAQIAGVYHGSTQQTRAASGWMLRSSICPAAEIGMAPSAPSIASDICCSVGWANQSHPTVKKNKIVNRCFEIAAMKWRIPPFRAKRFQDFFIHGFEMLWLVDTLISPVWRK